MIAIAALLILAAVTCWPIAVCAINEWRRWRHWKEAVMFWELKCADFEWQPIETAPNAGMVELATTEGEVVTGRWENGGWQCRTMAVEGKKQKPSRAIAWRPIKGTTK
jgi:hypothetical protein